MNPQNVSHVGDRKKVRTEYINTLRLQASNNQKNMNANRVLAVTGDVRRNQETTEPLRRRWQM